jgi:hypothetical protein
MNIEEQTFSTELQSMVHTPAAQAASGATLSQRSSHASDTAKKAPPKRAGRKRSLPLSSIEGR